MTDKQMYGILNDFANEHILAAGLEVNISSHVTSIKALGEEGASYENVVLLNEIIRGATHLLMWARRTNRVCYKQLKRGGNRKKGS